MEQNLTFADLGLSKEILQALSSDGLDCRMGSLHDTPAHFIDWLLPLT